MPHRRTVHLLAGLNGAGKTTLARELERTVPAVRFTLDEWMLRLYGLSFDHTSYAELVPACQDLIWDTALQVLATDTDVVLDWNLWNRARRRRWADRALEAGHRPVLHHVQVPLGVAIARTEVRNQQMSPVAHRLTPDGVRHLAGIFEEPTRGEGIDVVLHTD